ncbi:MAG TPA: response regulator transcription factor, partial [Stackebrandtia sp.]|uniref:helix-turn-helix transcriptional regulator n=1 Tax=Stackebrandtia sp. TaxID=2023065 RepID=UPI002D61BA03
AEALLGGGDPADRDEAAGLLREADGVAERLRAAPLHQAIQSLSRRARLRPAGAAQSADSPLTPRELAVLSLVAEGKTNRQIGAELYISDKTVSVHLSRVMTKLDAGSRTEAVSAAYTRGLLSP